MKLSELNQAKIAKQTSLVMPVSQLEAQSAQTKEERFQRYCDTMIDGFVLLQAKRDAAGQITDFVHEYVNAAACRDIGITQDEFRDRTMLELFPLPKSAEQFEAFRHVIETSEQINLCVPVHANENHFSPTRIFDMNVIKLNDEIAVTWRDITEKKATEEKLLRQELQIRMLIENMPLAFSRFDREFRCIYANPTAIRELGITAETVFYPDQSKFEEVLRTGQAVEYDVHLFTVHGESRYYHVHVIPEIDEQGQVEFFLVSTKDISEQKQMEYALRTSEERYRSLFESMGEGFGLYELIYDKCGQPVDAVVLDVNPGYEKLIRLSRDKILGQGYSGFFPAFGAVAIARYAEVVRTGQAMHFEQYNRNLHRWYSIYAYSLHKGNQFALIFTDITGRKQADEALRQSEELFHKTFHSKSAMVVIVSMADDKFIEVNQRFLDVIGYTRDEVKGHTAQELNLWAEDDKKIETLKEDLVTKEEVPNCEFRLRTKVGSFVTILMSNALIHLQGEICRIGIAQDITKEKELEAEMQRLDRLNLVGEMAASIGHEIRNPMTTVRGYLQLFQRRTEFANYQDQLSTMIEELDRANTIISEFLSLAKNKAIVRQRGSLNAIIDTMFPLIQADAFRLGHNVIVEKGDTPDNEFDPSEVRQLLLNLLRNAMEAMAPNGHVRIKTYCSSEAIFLEVKDNGPGIPAEILQQLGKPFVTTKENGTGLGLPVCYRIAERHNAELGIRSSPQGTTVCIKFMR